jgi:hypothetical protein
MWDVTDPRWIKNDKPFFTHAELDWDTIILGEYTNLFPMLDIEHADRLVIKLTITTRLSPDSPGVVPAGGFVTWICFGLP